MTGPAFLALWEALAQEPTPEQAQIEKALAGDQAQQAAGEQPQGAPAQPLPTGAGGTPSGSIMNPDISFIADVAGAWFSKGGVTGDDTRQSGDHDPTKNGFNLQELELAIGKSVDPYFRFDGHAVFSHGEFELEEAYATTLGLPLNLQARVGLFLTRVGRANQTHPHAWDFADQPLELGRLWGGDGNRGVGAELSWLAPLPWYVELVGSATDAGTARSFYGDKDLGVHAPADLETALALKQFFALSDDLSLLWGLSSAFGPNSVDAPERHRTEIYGSDVYLKYRPVGFASFTIVSLQAEWYARRRHTGTDTLSDHGGWAQLFWRFAQRWAIAGRYEYLGAGGAADPGFEDERQRVSANVTFWPTEFSRLRLQGSRDVTGGDPIWATFLTLEVVVGAHGAHAF